MLVGSGHPSTIFPLSCVFLLSFFAKDLDMEIQEDLAYILVTENIFHHSVT